LATRRARSSTLLPYTTLFRSGAELIAGALDHGLDDATRVELSLGSLLCAYALDATGFALHHVVSQTLVRTMNLPHAETNAALLPDRKSTRLNSSHVKISYAVF